ncbi:Hsp20/alpha crystallin family protein [Flammeovirgaceae bacterium SG7u.111]|nr:Hsp20/alpha crystallin family protein [Flammeovirgaceae bacterium SG7u.132]WPO34090.1 Hsp20/alpha crystallin family protein [Flammeovirgaceae bacterium SG7u.111]
MTLVKWNDRKNEVYPTFSNLFDSFFGDIGNVTGNDWHRTVPAVNVKENENAYELEVAAPGLKRDDFEINLDNDVLTISSSSKNETEESNEKYNRKEFSFTSFKRSFTLPKTVSGENISAKYTDGLLKLSIPKKEEVKPRSIKIS